MQKSMMMHRLFTFQRFAQTLRMQQQRLTIPRQSRRQTIIDTVKYSSLLPGKKYTMTGALMNKETGEPILIDGKKVTSSTTFTAEKAEGSVEVVFTFDASVLEGTTVVAYENLIYKGVEVGDPCRYH